jgi:hypothetical protein
MISIIFFIFFGIALFGYIQGGLIGAIKTSLLSGESQMAESKENLN